MTVFEFEHDSVAYAQYGFLGNVLYKCYYYICTKLRADIELVVWTVITT